MNRYVFLRAALVALLTVGVFSATPVLAAPHGGDRDHPPSRHAEPPRRPAPPPRAVNRRPSPPPAAHFDNRYRGVAHDYYRRSYVNNRCPPGLSRYGNRCVSHGARAWTRGRVLPRTVTYYDVPQPLLVELPSPPHGHRYVRVAGDILLIAVGTGLVVDALQDIFD
jgi:Ni/Co efflux regulator RcnB